jgi:hypothetical protein
MKVKIYNGKKSKAKREKRYRTERQRTERWRTGCVTHQLMRELEQIKCCGILNQMADVGNTLRERRE